MGGNIPGGSFLGRGGVWWVGIFLEPNRYGSDQNVSMNQTSCSCARIAHYVSGILINLST